MRRLLISSLGMYALSVFVPLALSQESPPLISPPEVAVPLPSKAQTHKRTAAEKINVALDSDTELDVVETEIGPLLTGELAQKHKITIVIDPVGLEGAGMTTDHLVTYDLKGVSLRSALNTILRPVNLTYVIKNEVLVITSLDCPDHLATVRTYPLHGLLEKVVDPSQLIEALEMAWPEPNQLDDSRNCKPRATVLAGSLIVRGSPRHHEAAEQLIEGLLSDLSSTAATEAVDKPMPNAETRDVVPPKAKGPTNRKPAAIPDSPDLFE